MLENTYSWYWYYVQSCEVRNRVNFIPSLIKIQITQNKLICGITDSMYTITCLYFLKQPLKQITILLCCWATFFCYISSLFAVSTRYPCVNLTCRILATKKDPKKWWKDMCSAEIAYLNNNFWYFKISVTTVNSSSTRITKNM